MATASATGAAPAARMPEMLGASRRSMASPMATSPQVTSPARSEDQPRASMVKATSNPEPPATAWAGPSSSFKDLRE